MSAAPKLGEFAGIDPAVACIDVWGPDAKRVHGIPQDHPPRPPPMAPNGSAVAAECRYTLADPIDLVKVNPREPKVESGKPRSHAAFDGWVLMHLNHFRYCAHCREKVWMPELGGIPEGI